MRLGIVPRTRGFSAGEAASFWAVRRDRGDLSSGEVNEFEAWIQDPVHADAYEHANSAMDVFDAADGSDVNLRALRQAALNAKPAPQWTSRFAAVAAAAVLVIAAGTLVFVERPGTHAPATASAPSWSTGSVQTAAATDPRDYRTQVGERRIISLPDGTKVTLDTQTRIATAFDKGERLVRLLHGTALFEVRHDAHWPFVVEAADRQVTALGTVFQVSNYPGRLHVLLVKGKVKVERNRDMIDQPSSFEVASTVLKPGEALVAELGMPQKVSMVDVSRQLLWRDGFVEFDDQTLGDAVSQVNRYLAHPIVLARDGAANLRVSGVFRTGSADSFVQTVEEVLPVNARPQQDGSVELSLK